ncbi:MAG: stage 0 sporulation family protein [Gemmatimonadales bacterium]
MPELVEVRFKGNRREFFTSGEETALTVGDPVVVGVERGRDFGRVSAVGEKALQKCGGGCTGCALAESQDVSGEIIRQASDEDSHLSDELRKAENDVRRTVIERVKTHNLVMKICDAEWQWDRKKLTIYFTADKRVDFRALVRDLAGLFRTRIDLRQIGARDEAKRLDGLGRCGRQYCCSSWLPELKPVSLSLAKDQRLSLNPSQISGGCGRLLCCLRYEHEFYVSSRKRFPKEGRAVRTPQGKETVVAVDIFREMVLLRTQDGSLRSLSLPELKAEVSAAEAAPTDAPAKPPADLITFDEGQERLTTEQAIDAVTPRKRRRRRRRRRRTRKPEGPSSPESEDRTPDESKE